MLRKLAITPIVRIAPRPLPNTIPEPKIAISAAAISPNPLAAAIKAATTEVWPAGKLLTHRRFSIFVTFY